jgi:hypothetical protein
MVELDRQRTLVRVAQLDGYLRELADIAQTSS